MSVMFDRSNSEALAASHASLLAPPDLPISVTCWAYVEAQPGQGETHTVWWFGRDGIDSQFVKLVFEADAQGAIKFRATFQASNNNATATATGYATGAWHCVSVVVEETTTPSQYRLRLYVDDAAAVEGTATASGAAVSDYDIFALGRTSGSTTTDYASCRIEQVAAWQGPSVLAPPAGGSPSDNKRMFDSPLPPRDAETELDIAKEPDLAYWMLVGHYRNELRVQNNQTHGDWGELFNERGLTYPAQQAQPNANPPRWSGKTPIFRWKNVNANRHPIQARPRKTPRSRLQPRFVFYQHPESRSSKEWDPSDSPVWTHPNFEHLGQPPFDNAGGERPPGGFHTPRGDLAIVAVTVADWFAWQGFAAGTGSEQNGAYEGSFWLRRLALGGIRRQDIGGEEIDVLVGWDLPAEHIDNPFGIEGWYSGIPLLQHPLDHIDQVTSGTEVRDIWNVWYRTNGVALCREWSEHFWQALKDELDERGLCYPARVHWDYEDQPDWGTAMGATPPIGNWDQMLADPRANEAEHPVYVEPESETELTMSGVDATRAGISLDPALDPWGENIDATNWLGGWMIAMRNSGLYKGVIEPGLAHFPHLLWGNYWDFVADNPDWRLPRAGPFPDGMGGWLDAFAFNTPEQIHADFSTPLMFGTPRMFRWMQTDHIYHYGATPSSLGRGLARARIDACVNARNPLPVTPWFFSPRRTVNIGAPGPEPVYYTNTFEDSLAMMVYAWQRGVEEFLCFTYPGTVEEPNDAWDQMWYVSNHLLDWVHMLPQSAQGERVARSNRLGRRQ